METLEEFLVKLYPANKEEGLSLNKNKELEMWEIRFDENKVDFYCGSCSHLAYNLRPQDFLPVLKDFQKNSKVNFSLKAIKSYYGGSYDHSQGIEDRYSASAAKGTLQGSLERKGFEFKTKLIFETEEEPLHSEIAIPEGSEDAKRRVKQLLRER